jgi:hypothetical protein
MIAQVTIEVIIVTLYQLLHRMISLLPLRLHAVLTSTIVEVRIQTVKYMHGVVVDLLIQVSDHAHHITVASLMSAPDNANIHYHICVI